MKVVIVKEIEEMPIDCDSCPFQGYNRYCQILGEYTSLNEWLEDAPYYDLKGKGDCPLKPMPEKKVVTVKRIEDIQSYSITEVADKISAQIILKTDEVFALGWNACLEELEK